MIVGLDAGDPIGKAQASQDLARSRVDATQLRPAFR